MVIAEIARRRTRRRRARGGRTTIRCRRWSASLDAVAPDAPIVWDEAGVNLCVDSRAGDAAAVGARPSRARARRAASQTRVNRVTGVPMEPRTAVG